MDRYDARVCDCDEFERPHVQMVAENSGRYVLAEDAVKLEAELAAARAENHRLRGLLIVRSEVEGVVNVKFPTAGYPAGRSYFSYAEAESALDAALKKAKE